MMKTATLLKRNLTYYWRTNLAVVVGVATAVAVLSGALIVGDSVRASLRELVANRLGRADHVVSSASFFREQLAQDLKSQPAFGDAFADACPLIALEAVAVHEQSGRRASAVQVYGVDDRFWEFHGRDAASGLESRDALVSAGLAEELATGSGDTLLIRVEKRSDIPAESLHGRKDDVGRTIRLTARDVLDASRMGEFSLRPQQGNVRAIFVPLARLQKDLEQEGKVNALLLSEKRPADASRAREAQAALESLLKQAATLEDLGVKLRVIEARRALQLESETGLINDTLLEAAHRAAADSQMRTASVLSYLANSIRSGEREIPYSLVTAFDRESFDLLRQGGQAARAVEDATKPDPIVLNEWAASDLGVKPGDLLELSYYVWQQEGRLLTEKAQFQLAGVVPIAGPASDRDLVPDYPGITESESLSDWDPPFPLELWRVRPRDEDYWHRYRTTPKAFIQLSSGQRLWQSRFGSLTSIRFHPPSGADLQAALGSLRQSLRASLDPAAMGLAAYGARAEGLEASRGATDFGEYFVYFSFFLVVSALLLGALFFKLGVEQRLKEIGLLKAIGFPDSRIRAVFLSEGFILATLGAALGLVGALLYGGLILLGLRTWWVDAVGTRLLALHPSATSLALGGAGGILTSIVCIAWTLKALGHASPRSLLAAKPERQDAGGEKGSPRRARDYARGFFSSTGGVVAFGAAGLLLLAAAAADRVSPVAGFFGAGTLLLIAFFCFQSMWLRRGRRRAIEGTGWWPVSRVGFRNTTYRPGRSVLCIALIASATFIIVAVDGFRRDGATDVFDKRSGTGGYPLIAESLLPIVHDPNTAEGRESLNLVAPEGSELAGVSFTRLRVRPGDDASCLNLYQPRNPRIAAPAADFLKSNRFSFQGSLAESAEERGNPWLLLEKDQADGAVPIIADANSMTYVLHLKLGDEFVLERGGAGPVRMRLVAALADSIFQGELLMSEENFLRLFPEQEGHRMFLIDVPAGREQQAATALEEQLSDFGLDVTSTAERLAAFHRVENTYLSTFQTLGGLGLVLGTLGLATVLLRNVIERRRELALLRAMGYNSAHFRLMVIAENAFLLLLGLTAGTLAALLAIAPALAARGGNLSASSIGLLLLVVLVTGLAASVAATAAALRSPLLGALRSE
jgi:putative ABC transport system permease protein